MEGEEEVGGFDSECKTEDWNHEDTASEKDDRNGEERENGEPE
jgi:hypothetical protein